MFVLNERLQRKLFNNLKLGRKVKTMTEENNASNWFQDNLRIIISVGIVILLVFAIYSYSKRNSRTDVIVDDSRIEEVAMTATSDNNNEINEIIDEIKDDQEKAEEEPVVETTDTNTVLESADEISEADRLAKEAAEQKAQEIAEKARIAAEERAAKEKAAQEAAVENARLAEEEKMAQEQKERETKAADDAKRREEESQKAEDIVREVIESRSTDQIQQKDGVIVVVAIHGDSMTTLARKAAKNYIAKNNVGNLTPSHKIYIEDYLRKKQTPQSVLINSEMTFAETDIAEAIERSQMLTDTQLNNLAGYAQNVSGL